MECFRRASSECAGKFVNFNPCFFHSSPKYFLVNSNTSIYFSKAPTLEGKKSFVEEDLLNIYFSLVVKNLIYWDQDHAKITKINSFFSWRTTWKYTVECLPLSYNFWFRRRENSQTFWRSISQARFKWSRREDSTILIVPMCKWIKFNVAHYHSNGIHLCWITLNLKRSKGWKFFLTVLFHVMPQSIFCSDFENEISRNMHQRIMRVEQTWEWGVLLWDEQFRKMKVS